MMRYQKCAFYLLYYELQVLCNQVHTHSLDHIRTYVTFRPCRVFCLSVLLTWRISRKRNVQTILFLPLRSTHQFFFFKLLLESTKHHRPDRNTFRHQPHGSSLLFFYFLYTKDRKSDSDLQCASRVSCRS